MDLHKLTTEEIRGFDAAKSRETENEVRRAMVNIRMDIYTSRNTHTAKIRGLRTALARILTVRNEAADKAPKAAKVAKPAAEAAAPKAAKAAKKPAKAKAKSAAKKPATK